MSELTELQKKKYSMYKRVEKFLLANKNKFENEPTFESVITRFRNQIAKIEEFTSGPLNHKGE